MLCQENNTENKNCGRTHQSHITPSNHNTTLNDRMWSSSQALVFLHIPCIATNPLITPNQQQKCFPKAVTESWELHRHQIHPGISYSGEEDGWKMWRMSAGSSETEREERRRSREERGILPSPLPSSPQARLNPVPLVVRMGQDRLAATCQVKLQNQTIKVRHVLYLNTITWRLRTDNPLKPDQRKSEFWSGLQNVFTRKRSWYGQLFTWLPHVIQLENTLHIFTGRYACFWSECTVRLCTCTPSDVTSTKKSSNQRNVSVN